MPDNESFKSDEAHENDKLAVSCWIKGIVGAVLAKAAVLVLLAAVIIFAVLPLTQAAIRLLLPGFSWTGLADDLTETLKLLFG